MKLSQLFHLRLLLCIHLDERRPGRFEAFAGKFPRRVKAELLPMAISQVAQSSTSDGFTFSPKGCAL